MNLAYPQSTSDTDIAAIEGCRATVWRVRDPEGISGLVSVTIWSVTNGLRQAETNIDW